MPCEVKLTDPLPFLFYPDGERIFYLSPGPAVLLFAIEFKDIVRNNLIGEQPVMQPTKHPFASVTGVCSFADDTVRRAFATTEIFEEDSAYTDTLQLWSNFCDAVAERLHEGEDLETVLETMWRLSSSPSSASCTRPGPGATDYRAS
jgi:hypothetical protein